MGWGEGAAGEATKVSGWVLWRVGGVGKGWGCGRGGGLRACSFHAPYRCIGPRVKCWHSAPPRNRGSKLFGSQQCCMVPRCLGARVRVWPAQVCADCRAVLCLCCACAVPCRAVSCCVSGCCRLWTCCGRCSRTQTWSPASCATATSAYGELCAHTPCCASAQLPAVWLMRGVSCWDAGGGVCGFGRCVIVTCEA